MLLKHPAWLWMKKHDPKKLPSIDANLQARFDEGHNYEPYAEQLFPDGVTLGWDPKKYGSYNQLLDKTTSELEKDTKVIFQGRFISGQLTFIFDIIEKLDDGSFNLYEVKATTTAKDEHYPDLSFQQLVMEQLGYTINNIYVVHLNNKYVRKGAINIKELSEITNVTDKVKALKPVTEDRVIDALKIMQQPTMPDPSPRHVGLGKKKDWMEIFRRLKPNLPEYSIYDLAGRNGGAVAYMENKDKLLIEDIPEDLKISGEKAKNQIAVTKKDRAIVIKPKIKQFLDELEFPLYFLDYEAFSKAVPVYNGNKPYQQVVFQYSVHILDSPDAELLHEMYLHTDDSNPIEPLAEHMMDKISDKGSVIVWHHVYERDRNREMAAMSGKHSSFFENLNERMIDLEIPFQKDWYVVKEFKGSSSIKAVLPVLVPELSYKELKIQDGLTTGRVWVETVIDGQHEGKQEAMFEQMRKYNTLDTLAMVEIYKKLIAAL